MKVHTTVASFLALAATVCGGVLFTDTGNTTGDVDLSYSSGEFVVLEDGSGNGYGNGNTGSLPMTDAGGGSVGSNAVNVFYGRFLWAPENPNDYINFSSSVGGGRISFHSDTNGTRVRLFNTPDGSAQPNINIAPSPTGTTLVVFRVEMSGLDRAGSETIKIWYNPTSFADVAAGLNPAGSGTVDIFDTANPGFGFNAPNISGNAGQTQFDNIIFGDTAADVFPDVNLSTLSFEVEASGADLVFTWNSQAGKVYDLLSSTDPETDGSPENWTEVAGQQDIPATPGTNMRTITRPADAIRFYAIREENAPPPPPVFFDDFESVPTPDWTTGANSGDTGNTSWQRGAPSNVGPVSGANGSANCFGTNLSADYGLDTDIYLRSPTIDLTAGGLTGATLTFQQMRDTDIDFEVDEDYGTVRVLKASDLTQLGADVVTDVEGADNDIWQNFSGSLPNEALGQEIILEFRFKSDNLGGVFSGWYIDDVTVEAQ